MADRQSRRTDAAYGRAREAADVRARGGGASGTRQGGGGGTPDPALAITGRTGPVVSPQEAVRAGVPEGNPYQSGAGVRIAHAGPSGRLRIRWGRVLLVGAPLAALLRRRRGRVGRFSGACGPGGRRRRADRAG